MSLLDQRASLQRCREVRKITLVGLLVNLGLAGMKFTAGVLGNSQALVADAVHSLSDLITDFSLLIGVKFWSAPADEHHPHGHGRIEILIAAGIGLFLGGAAIGIAYHGITSIRAPRDETIGGIALVAAIVSIVCKELVYQWTIRVGRRIKSQAVIANAYHHRSDAISSLPAAIAVAVATFQPQLIVLDSVGAIVVSIFILQAAWRIVTPALAQLVDRAAPEEAKIEIIKIAMKTPGVRCVYAVRTRYIGGGLQVDLRIRVDPELSVRVGHDISEEVSRRLREEGPEVLDVVVHLEPWESCLDGTLDCRDDV